VEATPFLDTRRGAVVRSPSTRAEALRAPRRRRATPARVEDAEGRSSARAEGAAQGEEHWMCTDPRVTAHVSADAARSYVKSVDQHIKEADDKARPAKYAVLASFVAGVILFGVTMGVFYKEVRIKCEESKMCTGDQDPLVDSCCRFWRRAAR